MKGIKLKFGNMRKEQDFTIYPYKQGEKTVLIQSDKTIAKIDIETGRAVYNSRPSGAYGIHLSMPDRKEIVMSSIDLQAIKMKIFAEGKEINIGNVLFADNSGSETIFE